MNTSDTGFAILLAFTLWSWVFVASFWSVEGGIAATVFLIVTTVYLDRHQVAQADAEPEGGEPA